MIWTNLEKKKYLQAKDWRTARGINLDSVKFSSSMALVNKIFPLYESYIHIYIKYYQLFMLPVVFFKCRGETIMVQTTEFEWQEHFII